MLHDKMDPNTPTGWCWLKNRHLIDVGQDPLAEITIAQADEAVRAAELPQQKFEEAAIALSDVLHKILGDGQYRGEIEASIDDDSRYYRSNQMDAVMDAFYARRDAVLAQYQQALRGEHPDQRSDLRREWTAALLEEYTHCVRADEALDGQCGLQGPDPESHLAKSIESTGSRLRALHEALMRRINAL